MSRHPTAADARERQSHAGLSKPKPANLTFQPSTAPRLDVIGSVTITDIARSPWTGKAPTVGRRFVQHFDGGVVVYGVDGSVAYHVPADQVASVTLGTQQSFVRHTPTWAMVLGFLGLFLFLIGIVFFFVKVNTPIDVPLITVTTTTGQSLVFVGRS